MTPKTITKQEAESKVAELVAWLAYADDVNHLRKLNGSTTELLDW